MVIQTFCNKNTKKVYTLVCKECNEKFTAPHNSYKLCPNCIVKNNTFICDICNNKFMDNTKDAVRKINHICNNCLNKLHGNGNFILRCTHLENHKFDPFKGYFLARSPNSKNMCPICFSKIVKCSNPECNNIINNIYIKDNKKHFCSQKCQIIVNSKNRVKKNIQSGKCIICNKFCEHRDALGFGIECRCSKNNAKKATDASIDIIKRLWKEDDEYKEKCQTHGEIKLLYCDKCNKITLHNGKFCCKCNPESQPGITPNFIIQNNVKFYKDDPVEEVIKKLDSGEYKVEDFPGFEKRYGKWTYRGKDILTDEFYNLTGLFHTIDNVKYYKQTPINELIKQLDSNEIEVPPGFNKRFGEWYYNQENILTGKITKLNGSLFKIKDKIEYYYDKSINDYIPWEDYKTKFVLKNTNFSLPEGFEWYVTFREQDSLDWSNARLAFERNLVENDVNWFVYIKFYYDKDNNLKPLVVGKSGSFNVNNSGSDISFSTNVNDGPARRFLQENNFNWCKIQIAILKCNNEQDAYQQESYWLKKLSCFSS